MLNSLLLLSLRKIDISVEIWTPLLFRGVMIDFHDHSHLYIDNKYTIERRISYYMRIKIRAGKDVSLFFQIIVEQIEILGAIFAEKVLQVEIIWWFAVSEA